MSRKPLEHIADAHRKVADAHKRALGAHKRARAGGPSEIRAQLIDAAERLLAERPVSAITTRDIARAAGLSDGVLYNYFADKNDLVVAALVRRFDSQLTDFESGLPEPGTGDIEENLVAYAEAWLALAREILPVMVGLLSEPALAHRFFAEIHGEEDGVRRVFGRIAGYLKAEQGLGRLGRFDVEAAVTALAGSMMAIALAGMTGERAVADGQAAADGQAVADAPGQVRGIVRTLFDGFGP